jgi:hypothetical protein
VDEGEIGRIKRVVKKNYKRDFNKNAKDRILEAIEYLRVNYPSTLLPMTLLYWMCNPGSDFLSPSHNDVLLFAKRVTRYRNQMLLTYGTSFYRDGHSKTHTGFFRAYIDRKELAKYESPKAGRNLIKALGKAETLSAAIGKVEDLKTDENFTSAQKEAAKSYVRLVANLGQSIKGYLPAPVVRPTTPPLPKA